MTGTTIPLVDSLHHPGPGPVPAAYTPPDMGLRIFFFRTATQQHHYKIQDLQRFVTNPEP